MSKKMKFKSAEEKRRYEENQKSWEALKKKYEPTIKPKAKAKESWTTGVVVPPGRECPSIRSLRTPGGDTSRRESPKYTGELIKGIATMHKSNAVPVIDDQQAKDISSMRR